MNVDLDKVFGYFGLSWMHDLLNLVCERVFLWSRCMLAKSFLELILGDKRNELFSKTCELLVLLVLNHMHQPNQPILHDVQTEALHVCADLQCFDSVQKECKMYTKTGVPHEPYKSVRGLMYYKKS